MRPARHPLERRRRALRGRGDRGQVTIWMLAFSLTVLGLGLGVGLEIWRVVDAWRDLAATADAAAAAGASGLDESAFRSSGGATIRLDPAAAERLAYESLDRQADRSEITGYEATATTDEISVAVRGRVDSPLLGVLRGRPLSFTVTATADPRAST